MSMASAMAATTARQRYAGDRRPAAVKQMTREEPGAHPEHDGAENKARGATVKRFDVHSTHGRATVVGGGVSATAVVKRIKQPVIEQHSIEVKLEPR